MPTSHPLAARTGGQILVDQLLIHGADVGFGVPGESYLAVLDAMHDVADRFRFVICRQEGGAANMADAYGKLTGKPGLCFVTRGPGATNASIGVHTAFQDSTPMILFIGQVGSDIVEREGFQEIDYRRMFGQMAKWVAQIDRADRIPEFISHAYYVATSGRPGPVVLALPEDMLTTVVTVPDACRAQRVITWPGASQMTQLSQLLSAAQRPLLLVGGSGWTPEAARQIEQFAANWQLPATCAFRFQDLFDNRHPNYVGDVGIGINPKLAERIKQSDLVLAVGPRLGEMTTSGYTLFDVPVPRQQLVHVHAGAEELGRVYQPTLAINASMSAFAEMAAALQPAKPPRWTQWLEEARADYEGNIAITHVPGELNMGEVIGWLRDNLPRNAVLTNGAGNYSAWVHRFYRYGGLSQGSRTQLAPTSGAMGYGVPAAVAAKVMHPDTTVIAFAGDGCFLMNGQELATAAQYDAGVIFIVVNNGMYGTIRMHQEREYPGRVSGTTLRNPDFVALAKAFGAYGELVTRTADFAEAFGRAKAHAEKHRAPALLELQVDPQAITPRATLDGIRNAARK